MIKSIIRIAVLFVLALVGFGSILAATSNNNSNSWLSDVIVCAIVGVVSLWLFFRYYRRWTATDKWLSAYDRWAEEGDTEI